MPEQRYSLIRAVRTERRSDGDGWPATGALDRAKTSQRLNQPVIHEVIGPQGTNFVHQVATLNQAKDVAGRRKAAANLWA